MLKVYLMLFLLAAAVFAESVRETETWMPLKDGESYDGSGDFAFLDEEHTTIDDEDTDDYDDDDDDNYRDMSGSGDNEENIMDVISKPGLLDNHIPDAELPVQPQEEEDINPVEQNEVAFPPSVHLSHAGEHNIFKKTEVLAAVIAGGVVGLLFAVLLILLLVYCLKKKDEGSYDLGKKPIYKKAPTTEIYA